METHEVIRLVTDRRKACGIGLCGSYAAICKWLNDTHGVLTSESWVEWVCSTALKESKP